MRQGPGASASCRHFSGKLNELLKLQYRMTVPTPCETRHEIFGVVLNGVSTISMAMISAMTSCREGHSERRYNTFDERRLSDEVVFLACGKGGRL